MLSYVHLHAKCSVFKGVIPGVKIGKLTADFNWRHNMAGMDNPPADVFSQYTNSLGKLQVCRKGGVHLESMHYTTLLSEKLNYLRSRRENGTAKEDSVK